MAKGKRSKPRPNNKNRKPLIEDKRDKLVRSQEVGDPSIPIRTVVYFEVGGFSVQEVQQTLNEASKKAKNGHPHYFVPLRHNKVENVYGAGTEIDFEGEFLDTVNRLCEVDEEGKIVLKDGAQKVDVIRVKING